MKNFLLLFLVMFALAGCRSRYDITLSNGNRFTGVSKPELNQKTGMYHFKTGDGREGVVPEGKIRLIEPHREGYAPGFQNQKR